MPRTLQKVFGRWGVVVYSEFSVLLWSKALVLDLDQAEQKCSLIGEYACLVFLLLYTSILLSTIVLAGIEGLVSIFSSILSCSSSGYSTSRNKVDTNIIGGAAS